MVLSNQMDARQLAVLVARAYYLNDRTKVEIAKEFDISRFKVARLLEMARTEGIVSISINESPQRHNVFSAQLQQRLGLRECIVVRDAVGVSGRTRVAAATATFLSSRLSSSDVLGLSWGRTLAAISQYFVEVPPLKIVQLTGSLADNLPTSPIEIMRRTASRSGGRAYPIIAPLIADNAEAAATIREQTDVRRAIGMFSEITIAVLSVGSWEPRTSQLIDFLTEEAQQRLENQDAEGEISGIFLSKNGEVLSDPDLERFICISSDQLRAVPQRIISADGEAKAGIVIAAVRSGLANTLIIDTELASRAIHILDAQEASSHV